MTMNMNVLAEPLELEKEAISFERVPTKIYKDANEASKVVAHEIAQIIRRKNAQGKPAVLGLATGSTPKKVYAELIQLYKNGELSFENVITFNLDEYYPMQPDAIQSYHRFMKEQLFDHINIAPENCHIPTGTLPLEKLPIFCKEYEAQIEELGGLDIQILGIGRNGHIGFNEPGSLVNSRTRLMTLDITTRMDATGDFGSLAKVPRRAVTMGIKAIMEAKRVVLLAFGEHKAQVIKEAIEGPVSEKIPASYLQGHHNVRFILDEASASELSSRKKPWLLEEVVWDKTMVKKAVTNLALSLDKPILKLTNRDYNENGLSDLLANYGQAYDINLQVFQNLQHTITGWPGGKSLASDANRPERAFPAQKRVLLFSPHPDDDIISMGGTFQRLVDQGHDVHVAYQTSGNIAVADDEALRFIDFMDDFNSTFEIDNKIYKTLFDEARTFLSKKKDSEIDIPAVRYVKGLIRQGEAKATCRFVGIPATNVHFLNMPFYETGAVQKNPIGEPDIQIVSDIISEIKPHQIFAAGDLADPHGTHKVCLDAIFEAIERLKKESFMNDCWVWLYRGAWAEWDIHEIEMAVPMSPTQVLQKRHGIFKHQSQKDGVVFQGSDSREFWQRAEDRNQATAELYNKLGFAEYAAIEAFVRYHF